ncbi:DUF402 domain-containing protein [Krasilnikoviella flava]|uniref:DUF402 domain-containing protein n=1 Tax=Krasilnikoviella flava TaxID=526729 RepID=A0A1T5M449_9MICO|nr:DUF402 domain-containing protein [Krasilnikoviella flava]SKC82588.1 Protein of unknown function [Krasilnikoviella flava]
MLPTPSGTIDDDPSDPARDGFEPVRVLHRTGQWCHGIRRGEALAYEVTVLPEYRIDGGGTVDRCYLLLDEGVQLTRPVTFGGELAGGWYVDLVELEEDADGGLVVHDLYVDILVPPRGRRYEILDLHDLADALESGTVDGRTASRVLRQTQQFVDAHLFDPAARPGDPWPDFPPAAIAPLLTAPIGEV